MADKLILMLKAPKSETTPIRFGQVVDQGGSMEHTPAVKSDTWEILDDSWYILLDHLRLGKYLEILGIFFLIDQMVAVLDKSSPVP